MKRVVLRVLVFLVIGVVVNVGMAWLPLIMNFRSRVITYPVEHLPWPKEVPCPGLLSGSAIRSTISAFAESESASALYRSGDVARAMSAEVVRAGYPVKCMAAWRIRESYPIDSARIRWEVDEPARLSNGINIEWLCRGSGSWPPLKLPLVPLWPAFATNSSLYALAASVVYSCVAVPRAMVRVRRRKRDLCLSCGYPIGVSPVCTECGGTVTAKTGAGA